MIFIKLTLTKQTQITVLQRITYGNKNSMRKMCVWNFLKK